MHPGDHHPAAVRGLHRLRGIEIRAVVDGLCVLPQQMLFVPVVLSDDAEGGVARVKLQAHGGHVLGARQQNVLAVQGEEVGAFPHLAVLIVAGGQDRREAPRYGVVAFEQEDGPAAVGRAIAHHRPVFAVLVPDLRVAEIVDAAPLWQFLGVDHRVRLQLSIVHPVADGDALGLIAGHGAV